MKSVADEALNKAKKIEDKYMDPDGIKDIQLNAESIDIEVNKYLDWRKRESFGLAQKLDVVSELSTKDPYGRHLIHTILYRELLNREMVKWIHDKISSTSEIERVLKNWTKERTNMEFELRKKIHGLLPKSWTEEHILIDSNKKNISLLNVTGIGRRHWEIADFIDRKPHAHKGSYINIFAHSVKIVFPRVGCGEARRRNWKTSVAISRKDYKNISEEESKDCRRSG